MQDADTPLILALQNGHIEIVTLLLEKGADMESIVSLHWADV